MNPLLPWTLWEHSENLSASVPHSGMPCGKSRFYSRIEKEVKGGREPTARNQGKEKDPPVPLQQWQLPGDPDAHRVASPAGPVPRRDRLGADLIRKDALL